MRRWQLAAKSSGAIGFFVRPAAAQREPSWAEARIAVTPLPGGTLLERRLRLERAGGAWPLPASSNCPEVASSACPGAAGNQSVEIVLDLERGAAAVGRAAGVAPRAAEGVRSGAVRSDEAIGPAASISERGVSCRAS
jgi:hypothetical protein